METVLMNVSERGCGLPQEGGMYFSIPTGPDGIDPRAFLMDPILLVKDGLGIKERGLTLLKLGETFHLVDWVGQGFYPNFTDWFMEFAHLGFHQRVETSIDFTKLDPINSRYLIVHPTAFIMTDKDRVKLVDDTQTGYDLLDGVLYVDGCPARKHNAEWQSHEDKVFSMCAGLSWLHIVKGTPVDRLLVKRQMPSFSYCGFEAKGKVKTAPGFAASFPISMMTALIYKGSDNVHETTYEKAKKSGLNIPCYYAEATTLDGEADE